jgi:nitrile hydratase
MVLPARPAGTEDLDADGLAALVTRNGLIGTALV